MRWWQEPGARQRGQEMWTDYRYLAARLVPNMSHDCIHIRHFLDRQALLLLSRDSNSTYSDAISTRSLLWPLTPRTYTNACKTFFSVFLISWRELIYNFSSCFTSVFIFSGGWQAILSGNHVDNIFLSPSPAIFSTSPCASHKYLSCWPIVISLHFQEFPSWLSLRSHFKWLNQWFIHLFICLCFYSLTQHILISAYDVLATILRLILCFLLNYSFHFGYYVFHYRARFLCLFAI